MDREIRSHCPKQEQNDHRATDFFPGTHCLRALYLQPTGAARLRDMQVSRSAVFKKIQNQNFLARAMQNFLEDDALATIPKPSPGSPDRAHRYQKSNLVFNEKLKLQLSFFFHPDISLI